MKKDTELQHNIPKTILQFVICQQELNYRKQRNLIPTSGKYEQMSRVIGSLWQIAR